MADSVTNLGFLDTPMKDIFDWSNSKLPVRDALWNYFMEKNGHNSLKTEDDMLPFMKDSTGLIETFINEHLKK